jgi:hydroxyacylglutathione hydrolase
VFFREVLNEDLGCASYVVGDDGEAAVIDPKWEVEDYLRIAEDNGLRISHILETHNHADHVSGRGRLVEATGATIHISRAAGVEYEHEPLDDGDVVEVGKVRIVAVATPGHRPEHISFLVEDTTRAESPWVVITGDSLFVGDLARPDLAVEPEEGARGLFSSLRRLEKLEDFVEVRPGHIGGSLCGGAGMSQKPDSTIGFERRFNRYLRIEYEDEFVRTLMAEQTPQPPNFEWIVELNRWPLITKATPVEPLLPGCVTELVKTGALLIDGRDRREFDLDGCLSGPSGRGGLILAVPILKYAVGFGAKEAIASSLAVDPNQFLLMRCKEVRPLASCRRGASVERGGSGP